MALTLPLFAPHRPSMPIVLLPSQLPVHQDIPTDRNPISQSLTSGGTPELRAHAISGRVPRERCYNAVLGKGTDKTRTRRRRTSTVSQARKSSPQGEICVQVSSVPRLLGALGTAPRRRVENEKWAATFPSGRWCSVSSSRNSSAAAAALTAITAPIRSEKMRERISLWWQRRRRKGNMR